MHRRIPSLLVLAVSVLIVGLNGQAPSVRITLENQLVGPQALAVSPDGSRIVYAANNRLYVQPIGNGPSAAIAGTEDPQAAASPAFSPDGRSIVFWSAADRTLKRIAVAGGTPVTICQVDPPPSGVTWESNDQIIFGQGPRGILRVAAEGGAPETIVPVKNGEFAYGPHLLPGGDFVLFTVLDPQTAGPALWDKAQIVVQSVRGGDRQTLINAGSDARYVPTGHLLYGLSGALVAVPFDAVQRKVTGPSVPVADDVRAGGNTAQGQFAVSSTGSLAYVQGQRGQVQVALVDRDGRRQPIGLLPDTVFAPRLSPNGQQLAVDAEGSIWVADFAGPTSSASPTLSPLRRIVTGGPTTGLNQFPLWSGDGERVIFTSTRDGGVQALYSQRADGTGDAELLVKPARSPESWSPQSGRLSYITLKGDTDYDVWTYSLRDKTTAPLLETPMTAQLSSTFSHDGRWVAYQANDTGRFEIYVQPVPPTGGKIQITKDGGRQPMWSVDDRQLFFTNDGRLFSVAIQAQPTGGSVTAGTSVALPIADFINFGSLYTRRQYDMTPDGKQFLMMFRVPTQVSVVTNWFDDLKRRVPVR